ncbi:TPA: hypothetical protein DEB00_02110 [Candidatus Uhrbacteria bacterium]|nr:hypothetical protein [Candidatus Uhrbacteria bacterium]
MHNQLNKILAFAQKTGDKVIVTDAEGREPMVIMPFDLYQHLIEISDPYSDTALFQDQEDDEMDTLAQLPEEFFVPEAQDEDDLALEEPKTGRGEPVNIQSWPETERKVPKMQPKLEEKESSETSEEEEQFYLEPVE